MFGKLVMLSQSMFMLIGSVEYVAFQSPPKIVGYVPSVRIPVLRLAKNSGSYSFGPYTLATIKRLPVMSVRSTARIFSLLSRYALISEMPILFLIRMPTPRLFFVECEINLYELCGLIAKSVDKFAMAPVLLLDDRRISESKIISLLSRVMA